MAALVFKGLRDCVHEVFNDFATLLELRVNDIDEVEDDGFFGLEPELSENGAAWFQALWLMIW